MPTLASVSKIDFPNKIEQQAVKKLAGEIFRPSFPEIDRMLSAFENTEITTRNFCKPIEYYLQTHTFREQNEEYLKLALEYSVKAIEDCMASAELKREEITDIIFISSTGIATPSMDALIINKMKLNRCINRMPIFGLGCGGGTSGFVKACTLAKANPDAVVLLVAVELCSLTFLRNDFSKSNFIGSSLFSDGIAACLIAGDNKAVKTDKRFRFVSGKSRLYDDTLDVMGWDLTNDGFKVLFSAGIPALIAKYIGKDVDSFLTENQLGISKMKSLIFHPGGKKVLNSYEEALDLDKNSLKVTKEVMRDYGNMSSSTVLYVLERFFTQPVENGYGLMMSMGPGFSSDMALLQIEN